MMKAEANLSPSTASEILYRQQHEDVWLVVGGCDSNWRRFR